MSSKIREFSFSMRTNAGYQETIQDLRGALGRHGFEILLEVPLDRELEWEEGLRSEHMEPGWQHYTIRIVWCLSNKSPVQLSDHDGGLLGPSNLSVGDHGSSTFAGVINRCSALGGLHRRIGIGLLVRGRTGRVYRVLMEFATQDELSGHCEVEMNRTEALI